jgi:predicted DNA-binding transcriptional regulator AlpA
MQWTTAPIRVPDVPLLTLSQVSVLVGYSTKTLRAWVKDGRFPAPRQVGDGKRWTALSVGVWLAWQDYQKPIADLEDAGDEAAENPKAVKSR